MKKVLLLLAVCFQLSQTVFASITTSVAKESGPAINGANLAVECDKYDNTTGVYFVNKKSDARVALKYTGENKQMYGTSWSVTIYFTLKSWNQAKVAMPDVTGSLKVEYFPTKGASYKDIDVFSIPNTYRTQLTVTGKVITGGITAIPADVILESSIETDRDYDVDVFAKVPLNYTVNNTTNVIEVKWPLTTVEEYDLEWVFISGARDLIDQPFSAKDWDNATRITTTENSYKINMIYDFGKLYFRMRLVGRKGSNFDMRKESTWSESPGIPCNFGTNRNWQYDVSYAEDGKSKEVLTFSDGSGRARQAITKLNSENTVVATETMYDFEGRQAIQTLPAPFNTGTAGLYSTRLDFYKQFNLNSAQQEFSNKDFDKDVLFSSTTCKPEVVDGMHISQGASNYYSPANLNKDGFNAAIPDANKFPYAQTVYDLEGNVKLQSGVGSDFRVGSGHETKYFNSTVLQSQLDRLFGNDVGEASHYSQKAAMDPNGQISVSYLDLTGKVIATFLSGDKPAKLDALPNSSEILTTDNFNALNKLSATEDAMIIDADYLVTTLTEHTFTYKLEEKEYLSMCSSTHTCIYDLTLSIFDECGQPVVDGNSILQHTFVINGGTEKIFLVNFPRVGKYKIRKKLTINQDGLNAALADFKTHLSSGCIKSLEQIKEELTGTVDFSECDGDECESGCRQAASSHGKTEGTPEWYEEVNSCILANCGNIPGANCDVLLDQLKDDMKPEGQYFDNIPFAGNGADQWLNGNVWDDCDIHAWEKANFRDKNNQLIKNWAALRANWKDEFSQKTFNGHVTNEVSNCDAGTEANIGFNTIAYKKGLVEFHPEYCNYVWCGKMQTSTVYDINLSSLVTFEQATTKPTIADPYIKINDPLVGFKVLEVDPYFKSTGEGYGQYNAMLGYLTDLDGSGPLVGMWAQSQIFAGCSNCDLQWQVFKALYIAKKGELSYQQKIAGCDYLCDNTNPPDLIADAQCGNNSTSVIGFSIREPYFKLNEILTDQDYCNFVNGLVVYYPNCSSGTSGFTSGSVCQIDPVFEQSPNCIPLRACLCDQFINYSEFYTYVNNDENPNNNIAISLHMYIADNLNLDYPPNPNDPTQRDVTIADVQAWMSNCTTNHNASPEALDLEGEPVSVTVLKQIKCDEIIPDCREDADMIVGHYANLEYQKLVNQSIENFIAEYKKSCLHTNNEELNVKYYRKDYQYTLYYYDQARNLIKTVPPAGVKLLSSDETEKVDKFRHNVAGGIETYPAHQLVSHYNYNTLNQLIRQNTPDGGETFFWYNSVGQLRFSKNARQTAQSQSIPNEEGPYAYTKYDKQGRIVEVGESKETPFILVEEPPALPIWTRGTLLDKVNDMDFPVSQTTEVTRTNYDKILNPAIDNEFPNHQRNLRGRVESVTYEDQVDNNPATYRNATHYTYDAHGNVSALLQVNKDLAVVGANIKKIEYDYDLASGSVKQVSYQRNAPDQFYHRYTYDDDNRIKTVVTSNDGVIWSTDAKYYYYLHGLLARMELGEKKVQGLDYAYTVQGWLKGVNNSRIDPLQDIGKDGIPGNKYDPNQIDLHKNVGRDAFAFSLHYFTGDYKAINAKTVTDPELTENFLGNVNAVNEPGNDLYNGNIKMQTVALLENTGVGLPTKMPLSIAHYRYDQLNRIKGATYKMAANNKFVDAAAVSDYQSDYTYDGNGNILTLNRNSFASGISNNMDDLTYRYDYNANGDLISNKLLHVNDAVSSGFGDRQQLVNQDQPGNPYDPASPSSWNYEYDEIGNLIRDKSDRNASIEWTLYGKIKKITHDDVTPDGVTFSDLEFVYDATGNRILKIAKPRSFNFPSDEKDWTYTYYVRDAQGNIMATYEKTYAEVSNAYEERFKLKENTIYGSQRLGVYQSLLAPKSRFFTADIDEETHKFTNRVDIPDQIVPICMDVICPVRNDRKLGNKDYELTDHLGNVLSVVSDNSLPVDETSDGQRDYFHADLVTSSDYYPFGSLMAGRQSTPELYRYGFNGKENDNELGKGTGGQQDYGMRIYDPRLGRFLSVDPITSQYPELTPYQFASNRPIDGIDLDGLEYVAAIKKFEYEGNWRDYVKAVDNGVINLLNIVPTTWNSAVASAQSLQNGTYLSDLGGELKQTGAAIKDFGVNTWNYTVSTPFSQQLINSGKTFISPQTLETAISFYAGSKIPIKGNKGNLLKTETGGSIAANVGSEAVNKYIKLFKPINEFDFSTKLYRGTTGSEIGSKTLFLTSDPLAAATYIKNGGKLMEYEVTNFSLKSLELSGELTKKTGMHAGSPIISTEYMFQGENLVEALNKIAIEKN